MRLPDDVTIVRPISSDEYGNPGGSFSSTARFPAKGFAPDRATLFLPAGTDVRVGDRIEVRGETFAVREIPDDLRSPSRSVVLSVALAPLEV